MQKTVHCSAIVAITWLLSVAVLISAAQFDVAQAKKGRAAVLACGKQLQKQCGGVPVLANNMQSVLKRSKENFPQDALHTPTMLCVAVREMHCSIASRRGRLFRLRGAPWRPARRYSRMPENRPACGFSAMPCGSRCSFPALIRIERRINTAEWVCPLLTQSGHWSPNLL